MKARDRILSILAAHGVNPGTVSLTGERTTLADALERAAVEPLIDAVADIDCCCRCCDERRDVLTRLAGGAVPCKACGGTGKSDATLSGNCWNCDGRGRLAVGP